MKSPLVTDRSGAAGVMTFMAKDSSLDCTTRKRVSDHLVSLARDNDEGVKSQVIKGLGQIRTRKTVAALQELAKSDSSVAHEDGKDSYPVRDEAKFKLSEVDNAGGAKEDPCDSTVKSK